MSRIFLHVAINVRPGKYQEFVSLLKKNIAIIGNEAGCEKIEIFQNTDQADVVHVYETWTDRASWDSHMDNQNSLDWRAAVSGLVFGETISHLVQL